jgi:hypothetical protein
MYYTIYQVTNKVNQKIYIGKHITKNIDDGYMGSGKLLRAAISKYGIENFEKQILYAFETEQEMNLKERELVTEEFCLRKDTYNLCVGGHGGFSYINRNKLNNENKNKNEISIKISKKLRGRKNKKASERLKQRHKDGLVKYDTFTGKTHLEETKKKISFAKKGVDVKEKNSQYGTMWITNGLENKKIKKIDIIPEGWYTGRILNQLKYQKIKQKNIDKKNKEETKIKKYQEIMNCYKNNNISLRKLSDIYNINTNTLYKNFKKYFNNEYVSILENKYKN